MTNVPLDRLAERAATDPFYFGFRLAGFAAAEGLDDKSLAALLGCEVGTLTHLRLCRAPRTDNPAAFREDVTQIASRFSLDAHRLAELAKPIPTTVRREVTFDDAPGVMLAARDRKEVS